MEHNKFMFNSIYNIWCDNMKNLITDILNEVLWGSFVIFLIVGILISPSL